jgi:general secretion pathway protein L
MGTGNSLKNTLRIALPALEAMAPGALLAYAWFDRQGRCARSGVLAAEALATAFAGARVEAILAPGDAIAATVQVPAVQGRILTATVHSALEPLLLSDIDTLAIGHGTRAADGTVEVAWADRARLARVWQMLAGSGLRLDAIVPTHFVLPADDPSPNTPLQLPADIRWGRQAPRWSLALGDLSPHRASPWSGPLRWGLAAAAVWLIGLNVHAARLRAESASLRAQMEQQFREAFPTVPVVVDAVRQAQQGRDALLAAGGTTSSADFVPLSLATAAALPFAAGHVLNMRYVNNSITLKLDDGGAAGAAPAKNTGKDQDMAAVTQRATSLGLVVERQEAPGTWRIARSQP